MKMIEFMKEINGVFLRQVDPYRPPSPRLSCWARQRCRTHLSPLSPTLELHFHIEDHFIHSDVSCVQMSWIRHLDLHYGKNNDWMHLCMPQYWVILVRLFFFYVIKSKSKVLVMYVLFVVLLKCDDHCP